MITSSPIAAAGTTTFFVGPLRPGDLVAGAFVLCVNGFTLEAGIYPTRDLNAGSPISSAPITFDAAGVNHYLPLQLRATSTNRFFGIRIVTVGGGGSLFVDIRQR